MRNRLSDAAPLCPVHSCIDDPTQSWVFWLCILFGFGFFLLLIVVVFLLSAVTCSCVSTGTKFNRKYFGSSYSMKMSLKFHFDSDTCVNYQLIDFF